MTAKGTRQPLFSSWQAVRYIQAHGLQPLDVLAPLVAEQRLIGSRWYYDLERLQREIIGRRKKPLDPKPFYSVYQLQRHGKKSV